MTVRLLAGLLAIVACARGAANAAGTVSGTAVELLPKSPAPRWTKAQVAEGFAIWVGDATVPFRQETPPATTDLARQARLTLMRGQYGALPIGIYALRDLNPVTVTKVECALPVEVLRVEFQRRKVLGQIRGIPFFLPRETHANLEAGRNTVFWLVIHAPPDTAPGSYPVTIRLLFHQAGERAIRGTVRVLPLDLPRPDVAFGFYYALRLLPPAYRTPEYEELYFRDMLAHGCNTTTLYAELAVPRRADGSSDLEHWDVTLRADAMLRAGILQPGVPALLLSYGPTDKETYPAWAERVRSLARACGWPELLAYSADEPDPKAAATLAPQMANLYQSVHPHLRVATAIAAKSLDTYGKYLDVWIVHGDGLTPEVIAKARKAGAELWTYDCAHRGTNALWNRFYAGLFTWATGVRGNFLWAYTHSGDYTWEGERYISHGYAVPSRSGPVGTVGLEGRREGIYDYAYLHALEQAIARQPKALAAVQASAWLRELRARIDWTYNRPEGFTDYYWDSPDLELPAPRITPEEYSAIRARCADYVLSLKPEVTK